MTRSIVSRAREAAMMMTEARQDRVAMLFDLDGTLVDSVYQHVLAWREAMQAEDIELAVWRVHRQIGMSGGLLLNGMLREIGRPVNQGTIERLQRLHAEAYE